MDTGSEDLISNLPDDLVCHILSFLSTKDAALTSVLAKRWRYLLAYVPVLDFDSSVQNQIKKGKAKSSFIRKNFKAFVDRLLALQGNAPLNKFSLTYGIHDEVDLEHVNGWISDVLDRGVVDFDLHICPEYYCCPPTKLLMSKNLVRLKVCRLCEFSFDEGEDFLPKLKTLHLDSRNVFNDNCAAFFKLISNSPVLEELVIYTPIWFSWESYPVSNPSLKRLVMYSCDDDLPKSVSFDTPNLVYLEYTGHVALKYPKVNFDSLIKARLDLQMPYYSATVETADATCFFMGMRNVEILCLSADTFEVFSDCCKAIPVFDKLYHLTIKTDPNLRWKSLPKLLDMCPKLETLIFEGLHLGDEYWITETGICIPGFVSVFLLTSSPVKILKVKLVKFGQISTYQEDMDKQRYLIKHFVESMPKLEQVILYYHNPSDDYMSVVSTELQKLEKVASSRCKIQVIFGKTSASSTVHSSSSN